MKKTFHHLPMLALGLGLTLSLGSCKDNDLSDGGANGGNGAIETEADAQKYETLQTLLGALASVDSLPDNWNSDNYTVLPTVGVVKDEANAHVRYVITSSQEEADRIYRSYLSKNVTGTPSDDSWQQEGIGSMQFKLENSDDLFATLKVNVKQIPTLEEVRFVSAEALGNNGWGFKPTGCYYSFGDVIYQQKGDNDQPTFWVCVRPCSKEESLRKSHWCTFQLRKAKKSDPDANFVSSTGDQTKPKYLPTELTENKSDAERMVQNFFNVLRLIAKPDLLQDASYTYKGIGEIKAKQFTYDDVRAISYMWDYLDLWNQRRSISSTLSENCDEVTTSGGVVNKNYSSTLTALKYYLMGGGEVNAYYAGYKKSSWYNKGDYNIYNLRLTYAEKGLYDKVMKQTYYVNSNDAFDFTDFESGCTEKAKIYSTDDYAPTKKYQFIVKHRTGAELEEATKDIDVEPAKSFSIRADNGIKDILVSDKWRKQLAFPEGADQTNDEPFFSFGDAVSSTKKVNDKQMATTTVCVKPASRSSKFFDADEARNAWFIVNFPDQEYYIPKNLTRVNLTENGAKIILFHILNGYVAKNKRKDLSEAYYLKPNNAFDDATCSKKYSDGAQAIYTQCSNDMTISESDDHTITLQANINGKGYQLTYNYQNDRQGANFNDVFSLTQVDGVKNALTLLSYKDEHRFYEDFSDNKTNSRNLNGSKMGERKPLKAAVSQYNETILSNF